MIVADYICPEPGRWQILYEELCCAFKQQKEWKIPNNVNEWSSFEGLPTPLILTGWAFSTDQEKGTRWQETISWAKVHGLEHLLIVEEKDRHMPSKFGGGWFPEDVFTHEIILRYGLDINRVKVSEYLTDSQATIGKIPAVWGVYFVIDFYGGYPENFLETGSGGFFKGKNPNVNKTTLWENWVEDANILYIGRAGGVSGNGKISNSTLKNRWRQRFKFATGHNVGAWGGRYLWQCENSKDFYVCWYPTPDGINPIVLEKQLIEEFRNFYGKLPFANL